MNGRRAKQLRRISYGRKSTHPVKVKKIRLWRFVYEVIRKTIPRNRIKQAWQYRKFYDGSIRNTGPRSTYQSLKKSFYGSRLPFRVPNYGTGR